MVAPDPEVLRRSLPGASEVDPELIEELVTRVNAIVIRRSTQTAREVTQCVVELLAHGDLDNLRAVAGLHATLKALRSRNDLHVSYTFVWSCLAIEANLRKMPAPLADALPFSHHRALLTVKDDGKRLELATRAAALGLSARALADAIAEENAGTPRTGKGRRPAPRAVNAIRALGRLSDRLDDFEGHLRAEHVPGLLEIIERHQAALTRAREHLERRRDAIDG